MKIINKKYYNLERFSKNFKDAKPYPHLVLDNFLIDTFFNDLKLDNYTVRQKNGRSFNTDLEKNKWTSKN